MDGSLKDRFVFIEFNYDEELETAISPNKDFTGKVQALRATANRNKLRVVISPRLSITGGKLLAAGFTEEEALHVCLGAKISETDRATLGLN